MSNAWTWRFSPGNGGSLTCTSLALYKQFNKFKKKK